MPYFVTDKADGCSGWATVKGDGEVIGCHKTKVQAVAQMVAVSLAEDLEPGGERLKKKNKMKKTDYRVLPDNYRPSLSDDVPEGRACGNCIFYKEDDVKEFADGELRAWCEKWDDYVNGAYYCNAWQPYEEELEEELEETRQTNLTPPTYMRAAARRGLELNRQGFGGDGLTDKTLAEARAMADGRVSEDKWRRIGPWIARHLVDLDAPKNNNPDDPDYPGAGLVAHFLWGSGPTKTRAVTALNYAENVVEKLDEKRHLPGGHDQLKHGAGGSGPYKAGNWVKASAADKKAILERRYGAAADKAVGGELTREQKIKEMARIDQNNIDNKNNEVYMNGENHTVIFTRGSKNMFPEEKEELFKNIDELQAKFPLEQMDVEIVPDWRSTKGMSKDGKAAAYTSNDGLKIGMQQRYQVGIFRNTPEELKKEGIVIPFKEGQFMGSMNRVPVSNYTMAHEWGHAWESKQLKLANVTGRDRLRYEINRDVNLQKAIKEGNLSGGFMSDYGKTGNSESYAEAFADFYLSNGEPLNAVTEEMAKVFKW